MREKLAWLVVPAPALVVLAGAFWFWGQILLEAGEHDEWCSRGLAYEDVRFTEEVLDRWSLTSTCVFSDGRTHVEQTLPWLPTLVAVLLVAAVGCAVVGGWAMWSQRSGDRARVLGPLDSAAR